MNSSGKVVTIILVIISILIITLLALSLWALNRETSRRKLVEVTLEEFQAEKTNLEENLKEIKKQNFLLQEKNKEADERVNDLSDEVELEKGLREEMKIEAEALKTQVKEALASEETLVQEIKLKEDLHKKLTADLTAFEQKIKSLEAKLEEEIKRSQKLGKLYEQQQREISRAEEVRALEDTIGGRVGELSDRDADEHVIGLGGIELEEIIVAPGEEMTRNEDLGVGIGALLEETVGVLDKVVEGRILSVDTETEFVIVSLGEMDGVEVGNVLSVYRDENYVGDIRVTRLQPEMSAADLIPPFSIRSVKKNDQVKAK